MNLHTIPGFAITCWLSYDDINFCLHQPRHGSHDACAQATLGIRAGTRVNYCDCIPCYDTNRIGPERQVWDHWGRFSDMTNRLCQACSAGTHPRPPHWDPNTLPAEPNDLEFDEDDETDENGDLIE